MKLWLLLFMVILLPLQSFAGFYARNLTNPGYDWHTFKLEQIRCDVDVMGLFYQTTITFKIVLTNTETQSPYAGNYEMVWDFTLMQDVVITDCWLQPANSSEFINADIMDMDTAEKNYELNPHTVPRMLLRHRWERQYNGALYKRFQMRFTLATRYQSPTIKIQYISPCLPYYNVRRVLIPLNEFSVYRRNQPVVLLKDLDNLYAAPQTIGGMNTMVAWHRVSDSWQATFYSDYFEQLVIGCAPESPDRSYLRICQRPDAQFYQLSLLPPLTQENRKAKNILLAVDLTDRTISSTQVIQEFKKAVQLSTTEQDSMTLLYSAFTPAIYDSNFVPATALQVENIFKKLLNQPTPSLNTLPHLLRQCVRIFNIHKKSGEIWLVTNANSHSDPPETALEIISQTTGMAEHPIKFRIISADMDYWPSQTINQQTYIGNDFLYENLTRLSWGSFVNLRDNYQTYNFLDAMLDCIAPTVTSVEIAADPAGGLSYSRFQLNRGRVNFPITLPYYEIGLFDGAQPFNVNFFGLLDGDLFAENTAIARQPDDPGWEILSTYWYDRYVQNLLAEPQSFETIDYIEKVSVAERLLTPYSGFIIPGAGGVMAFTRLTEQTQTAVQPIEKNTELPQKFELTAYPNPFNSSTTVLLPPGMADATEIKIAIFNCLGQIIRDETLSLNQAFDSFRFQWDGLDNNHLAAATGVYIICIRIGEITQNIKVTLLR